MNNENMVKNSNDNEDNSSKQWRIIWKKAVVMKMRNSNVWAEICVIMCEDEWPLMAIMKAI